MKKSIMTFFIVFSSLIFVTGAAYAGGESSHSFMGKVKSMMGENPVFHQSQRLSKLIGSEVVNNKGKKLGKISDLIADEDGKISYMVLSRGGMFGMGSKLVAIPMSAVEPRAAKNGEWRINMSKKTLDQAPAFTASKYPDFSNEQWQDKVRGYFENNKNNKGSMPSSKENSSKPMHSGGY